MRGGIYWFNLFVYYTCAVALFFVMFMECFSVMWGDAAIFDNLARKTMQLTGGTINPYLEVSGKYFCAMSLVALFLLAFGSSVDMEWTARSRPTSPWSSWPWTPSSTCVCIPTWTWSAMSR